MGGSSALTADEIDFDCKIVSITHSLQSHDLRVDDFYLDTTKTIASRQVEELPDFADKIGP